jgi:predicted DNA-binding transcriptional regulator AlpA
MVSEWVRIKEAAHLCGVSRDWLGDHRTDGAGPPFHLRGGKVIYNRAELEVWIASQRKERI